MKTAAFIPNLMDRSRFAGLAVVFVSDAADLNSRFDRVLVDLDRCDDPGQFVQPGLESIGFFSHVDTETQAKASADGYNEVLARSQFFRRLRDLL